VHKWRLGENSTEKNSGIYERGKGECQKEMPVGNCNVGGGGGGIYRKGATNKGKKFPKKKFFD